MKSFLLSAILSMAMCVSVSFSAATWCVDGSISSSGDGASWETAVKTIQQGVDLAGHGDTVLVGPGTYGGDGNTGIHFDGKPIALESRDGASATAIDCEGSGWGFKLRGSRETRESIIRGFTIKNGHYAIECMGSSPTIRDCVITRNNLAGIMCGAEGTTPQGEVIFPSDAQIINCLVCENPTGVVISCSDPTIMGCRISQNYAGGIWSRYSIPSISDCEISENRAAVGGGIYFEGGRGAATILNCAIVRNTAEQSGGGIYFRGGATLDGCVVGENQVTGGNGGGVCGLPTGAPILNCVIVGNKASGYGGGVFSEESGPPITNCTIVGNLEGGGLHCQGGDVINTVLWGNLPQQALGVTVLRYCNIEGGWPGAGNISADPFPFFLNPTGTNYRLHPDSPCIDAGTQKPDVVTLPETDIVGMHRIMYGGKALKVDMGAYEFHIWPPTENGQTGEITLKWSSLAGKTYTLYHSSDMLLWDVLADDVASAGDTVTTWVDSMGPVLPPGVLRRYYKVIENE